MTKLRFYMDENINPEVAVQLARIGIEVVTVRDLELLGDSDTNHLKRDTEMGFVLCTQDSDFLQMHSEDNHHSGIAFGQHYGATVGGWVKALRKLYETKPAEDVIGQVEYLSVK
ncbi:MAG: DUF5615 family PIN-like protein [Chloroflexi bacterium]|nr:DUF5615 family PIN-like protein [Chloroflexota bacterium]MCC6895942.1 DUF5615 family PIN-like protein [Anaerolineae bacterium]